MRERAFTLIELMVVVVIIVLLVGILIPALGGAKKRAKVAETSALMSHIQTDIDSYFTIFNAYPGPMPLSATSGSGKQLSGAQNLLIGLTLGMSQTSTGATSVKIAPGMNGTYYSDPNVRNGPVNYAAMDPTGKFQQLSPFFDAPDKELSTAVNPNLSLKTWPAAGVSTDVPNACNLPVIVDTFTDGLPILYFRRTPGVETPVATAALPVSAAYYWDENKEYTSGTKLVATSGVTCPQGITAQNTNTTSMSNPSFATLPAPPPAARSNLYTAAQVGGGSSTRGGYILMSAGPDRFYGSVRDKNNNETTSDDIVIVGGN